MTSTGGGGGVTLQGLSSVKATVSEPVEQASGQVGDGREVEDGDTRQTSGDGRRQANESVTDTVLGTETQSDVCDDAGTGLSALQEVQVGLGGSSTSGRDLRRVTRHVRVDDGGDTNGLRSGRLATAGQELDDLVGDIQNVVQGSEVGHTVQTVVDVVKSLGDSVTDTALETQTQRNVSDDGGALVEARLLVAGGSGTRCDGRGRGSLGEEVEGRAGGNHGGSDAANGHLGLLGETLLLESAEHRGFGVELIDGQALQALRLVCMLVMCRACTRLGGLHGWDFGTFHVEIRLLTCSGSESDTMKSLHVSRQVSRSNWFRGTQASMGCWLATANSAPARGSTMENFIFWVSHYPGRIVAPLNFSGQTLVSLAS